MSDTMKTESQETPLELNKARYGFQVCYMDQNVGLLYKDRETEQRKEQWFSDSCGWIVTACT
jgi:hypothetical protein